VLPSLYAKYQTLISERSDISVSAHECLTNLVVCIQDHWDKAEEDAEDDLIPWVFCRSVRS
jgi:hypothetical protein